MWGRHSSFLPRFHSLDKVGGQSLYLDMTILKQCTCRQIKTGLSLHGKLRSPALSCGSSSEARDWLSYLSRAWVRHWKTCQRNSKSKEALGILSHVRSHPRCISTGPVYTPPTPNYLQRTVQHWFCGHWLNKEYTLVPYLHSRTAIGHTDSQIMSHNCSPLEWKLLV